MKDMLHDMAKNWEQSGLLIGLSKNKKKICSKAFDSAYAYLMACDKNQYLEIWCKQSNVADLLSRNLVSITMIKSLFSTVKIGEVDMIILLLPMIRRIIERRRTFDFDDFIMHCKKCASDLNLSALNEESDVESEICAIISDTY